MNAGEVIAGKYRVLRRLGEGGMGLVVLAEHVHLGEHVAIKVMSRQGPSSPEASARFLREARAAARLKGEHIARATDFGVLDSGAPYIVLEYLEGCDLGAYLRTNGRLVTPEAVGYVLQACEGIAEAHAGGIVHRDLKPANLFLTRSPDGSPLVKVLDFGVAKSTQPVTGETSGLTGTGAMMGSPIYMSPEQLKSSKEVGPTADVWALCVVLFELLTGRQPFNGETFPAIAGAILYVPSPDPCADRQAIPRALGNVVLKGLAKEPKERFQSVGELARALAPFAPEEAQIHAGRASRILRESAAGIVPSQASVPVVPVVGVQTGAAPNGSGPHGVGHSGAAFRPPSAPAFAPQGAQAASFSSPAAHSVLVPGPGPTLGSSTTTSGHVHPGELAKPPSRVPVLAIVLGGMALVGFLAVAGLGAHRYAMAKSSASPDASASAASAASATTPTPSATAADTVAAQPSGLPSSAPPPTTPSPSAHVQVAPWPTPKHVTQPKVTPAPAPPQPSVVPKPDCNPPIVTDPKTGEVRVKPGCR